ncbi:hypothetical protein ABW20_dc0100154 [Dactylellina cionopaga]|nr:hypothetical protein ABW20_dc0100154 [Dactylellina cionopaga]
MSSSSGSEYQGYDRYPDDRRFPRDDPFYDDRRIESGPQRRMIEGRPPGGQYQRGSGPIARYQGGGPPMDPYDSDNADSFQYESSNLPRGGGGRGQHSQRYGGPTNYGSGGRGGGNTVARRPPQQPSGYDSDNSGIDEWVDMPTNTRGEPNYRDRLPSRFDRPGMHMGGGGPGGYHGQRRQPSSGFIGPMGPSYGGNGGGNQSRGGGGNFYPGYIHPVQPGTFAYHQDEDTGEYIPITGQMPGGPVPPRGGGRSPRGGGRY